MASDPVPPPKITARTPAAQASLARFMARYEEQLARAKKEVALDILVWGPGPTSLSPVRKKRQEIHEKLIQDGHNAMMSEDLTSIGCSTVSEKSKEFSQALLAHLVVVLPEDSPGALAEVHDFANHPEIAAKMVVMFPRKYASGYSAIGAVADLENAFPGALVWYEDNDIAACKLLGSALKRAEALRQLHFRHRLRV